MNISSNHNLNAWFQMIMKEARRNSYVDLYEDWGFTEEEIKVIEEYIEQKLNVKLI